MKIIFQDPESQIEKLFILQFELANITVFS